MKNIALISRILVGIEFIFSGFVKVVDPYGTSIKLQEYFEVFAKDLPAFSGMFHFFAANSLGLSLTFCCLEFILGFALLFNFKLKYTAWVALVFMVFFTFLTFYSAFFNRVTDCGCFGDFLKLKPWHSFYKDLISLIFIGIIFVYRKNFVQNELGTPLVLIATIISLGIGIYAIRYSPILEFVPYAVGKNIPKQMEVPKVEPIINYVFLDKTKNKEFEAKEYLEDTTKYKYISSETLNQDELTPKITDFSLEDAEGVSLTKKMLEGNILFFVIKDSKDLDDIEFKKVYILANKSVRKKVKTVVLTSMPKAEYDKLKSAKKITFDVFNCDEKVLKTMARTNPSLLLVKDGTVKGKWSLNNLPTFEKISELLTEE